MRITCLSILLLGFISNLKGQPSGTVSAIIREVSSQWKLDSNSCKGYRQTVARELLNSQTDTASKQFIFSYLGTPNKIQKFFDGNTGKNYVGYIYYTYKDSCPKIHFEGYAIQFVFDESETHLIEIKEILYCG